MDGAGPIAGDYNGTLASLIALVSFLKAVNWTWSACVAFLFDICCEAIVWAGVVVGSLWISPTGGDRGFAPHPSDYQIAAQHQGWTRSTSMVGSITKIGRESDGRLTLSGWAYDKEYDEPLAVFAFVGGGLSPSASPKAHGTMSGRFFIYRPGKQRTSSSRARWNVGLIARTTASSRSWQSTSGNSSLSSTGCGSRDAGGLELACIAITGRFSGRRSGSARGRNAPAGRVEGRGGRASEGAGSRAKGGARRPLRVPEEAQEGTALRASGGLIRPKVVELDLDPLLITLLKKIPDASKGWSGPNRVRWFQTFAMNVSQIYDAHESEPVEMKIDLETKGAAN
jgi:hypothetical protein